MAEQKRIRSKILSVFHKNSKKVKEEKSKEREGNFLTSYKTWVGLLLLLLSLSSQFDYPSFKTQHGDPSIPV